MTHCFRAIASITGKIGSALHTPADAVTHLESQAIASLQTGDTDYTVACWVKFLSNAGEQSFLEKTAEFPTGAHADEYLTGWDLSSTRFRFFVCGGPTPVYTSASRSHHGRPQESVPIPGTSLLLA